MKSINCSSTNKSKSIYVNCQKEEEEVKTKNNKCILAYLDANDKTNIVHIDCLFNEDGTKIIETKTRNKKECKRF